MSRTRSSRLCPLGPWCKSHEGGCGGAQHATLSCFGNVWQLWGEGSREYGNGLAKPHQEAGLVFWGIEDEAGDRNSVNGGEETWKDLGSR